MVISSLYVQVRDFFRIFPELVGIVQGIPDLGEEGIINTFILETSSFVNVLSPG